METFDYRLEGKVTLLGPLSHIGESLGPDSFLAESVIINERGRPVECFLYSGNAMRGMLRDKGVKYLLDKLGDIRLPLETFYLLFSGGSLGGEQKIDIEQARMYRKMLPVFSIFGGGAGNQIIGGKMKVGQMVPLVKECQRILPERLRDPEAVSWRQWTMEQSFTRKDDAKDEELRNYLYEETPEQLPAGAKQYQLEGTTTKGKKKEKKGEDAPQQMRYSVECLAPGSVMYHRIDLQDMTELEMGAFVSAFVEFSRQPYIGGKSGVGFGLVEMEYDYFKPFDRNSLGKFMEIRDEGYLLSKPAKEAKEKYDQFLLDLYNSYIESKESEIRNVLEAGK